MGPMQFVSMNNFHRRRLLPGEPLSIFVHELKRLLDQAMLEIDATTQQQLLLHQFLTGIPVEVSKQLQAVGEIEDLDRIMQQAKLLMTLEYSKNTAAIGKQQTDAIETLKEQVATLTEQVAATTTQPTASQPVSYASGAANLDTYKVIALTNQNDVIRAEETDIASECRLGNRSGVS